MFKSIWDEIYLIPSLIPAHHVNSERNEVRFHNTKIRCSSPCVSNRRPCLTNSNNNNNNNNSGLFQCQASTMSLSCDPSMTANYTFEWLLSTYSFHTLPFKNTNTLFNVQLIDFRTKNSRWTESAFFFILSPMYDQLLHSTYEIVLYTLYAITMKRRCSHRIDPIV